MLILYNLMGIHNVYKGFQLTYQFVIIFLYLEKFGIYG